MAKEIVQGDVYIPNGVTEVAKDLILWLLNRDPSQRPNEFSEIKNHRFFEDIHWGKFAKKKAVPPWLPDLNEWHFNPKFMKIPMEEVFGSKFSEPTNLGRESFYLELKQDSMMIEKLSVNSFRYDSFMNKENQVHQVNDQTSKTHLEGFDLENSPEQEIVVQEQIDAYRTRKESMTKTSKNATN